MLPNLNIPPLEVFGLRISIFNVLLMTGVFLGVQVALRRGRVMKLAGPALNGVLLWGTVFGFLFAHVYNDLLYYPHLVAANPLHLLKFWDGVSSTGGILGAVGAGFVYLRWRHPGERFLPHLDVYIYAFTFAWILGRLGCTIVFDHPGLETDFFLGMEYQGRGLRDGEWMIAPGVRHNVGMYELLWTLVVASVMVAVRKRPHFPGFYACLFFIPFALYRFPTDFLRVAEARTLGLQGGQWASLIFLVLGVAILVKNRSRTPSAPDLATFD